LREQVDGEIARWHGPESNTWVEAMLGKKSTKSFICEAFASSL